MAIKALGSIDSTAPSPLKALALEALVAITDSMVAWEREAQSSDAGGGGGTSSRAPRESVAPSSGEDRGASALAAAEGGGRERADSNAIVVAPDSTGMDFEAVFHRKAELQEGVIKFNMKPKKVSGDCCLQAFLSMPRSRHVSASLRNYRAFATSSKSVALSTLLARSLPSCLKPVGWTSAA